MYISDLTGKIRSFRDNANFINEETYDFLDHIIDNIETLAGESVRWSVDDFLTQALNKENVIEAKYLKKYDPSKFQEALERMIDKHDAPIGITWDTIDFYLDEMCKSK